MKPFTSETLVSWHQVKPSEIACLSKRLSEIKQKRPDHIPPLICYGFVNRGLRLEVQKVLGERFDSPFISRAFELKNQNKEIFFKITQAALQSWAHLPFIHGDLSPRNILVQLDSTNQLIQNVWFIDWLLDLKSYRGTPKYCSPQVFHGKRSPLTDQFALETILKSWG